MWTKTRLLSIALISAFLCLSLPCAGSCSESRTYQISESELQTLQNHLDALEANNETLKAILSESGEELTQALNALTKSNEELTRLKAELKQCKTEAENAQASLLTANEELAKASESFKQCNTAHDKTEGRLRAQRNIWEALFFIACGVAAAR